MNKKMYADKHGGKNKSAEAELKRKDKENKKLQQELTMVSNTKIMTVENVIKIVPYCLDLMM